MCNKLEPKPQYLSSSRQRTREGVAGSPRREGGSAAGRRQSRAATKDRREVQYGCATTQVPHLTRGSRISRKNFVTRPRLTYVDTTTLSDGITISNKNPKAARHWGIEAVAGACRAWVTQQRCSSSRAAGAFATTAHAFAAREKVEKNL